MFVVMVAEDEGCVCVCKNRACIGGCFQLSGEGVGGSEKRAIRGWGTAAQSS